MNIHLFRIFIVVLSTFIVTIQLQVSAQVLEYTPPPANIQRIAVIPIASQPRSLFADNTKLVANILSDKLRNIPGIEVLNILSSLRAINNSKAYKNLSSIEDSFKYSLSPDPYDLSKVAELLNADKLILVSGGFDTQSGALVKAKWSYVDIFGYASIKPLFKYNVFITMYDPVSGVSEWRKAYNKSFQLKNMFQSTLSIVDDPTFLAIFTDFTEEIGNEMYLNLYNYFYSGTTFNAKGKIIEKKANDSATDGDMTTDGHSNSSDTLGNKPITEPDSLNNIQNQTNTDTDNSQNTSVTDYTLPSTYEDEVIKEYQVDIINKSQ